MSTISILFFHYKLKTVRYLVVLTGSKDGTMILGEIEAGLKVAI